MLLLLLRGMLLGMLCGCLSLFLRVEAADEILLYQPVNQNGPETLLICIPGMDVPALAYEPICTGIQKSLSMKAWLAIMSFRSNTVNPIAIERGFDMAVELVQENGFTNVSNSDVFVWAHSAGGAFGTTAVAERGYAGYLLSGSYLFGINFADFPLPVLSIGGELDGLTQTSKVAEDYRVCRDLIFQGRIEEAVTMKSVIIVQGVNHAQMANNYPAPFVFANDFQAEVTLEEAVSQMVSVAAAFIEMHRIQGSGGQAFQYLYDLINETDSLLTPFLMAQDEDEGEWCARSQRIVANLNNDNLLQVANVNEPDFDSFLESKPEMQVVDGVADVVTHNFLNNTIAILQKKALWTKEEKWTEIYSEGSSATEIGCKGKSQEAITQALGTSEYGVDGKCVDVHLAIYDSLIKSFSARTRERYLTKGKQLAFLNDILHARGDLWSNSHLIFDTTQNPVQVIASRLTSPLIPGDFGGATYCKGVPAARIAKWMMHNCLPRGL